MTMFLKRGDHDLVSRLESKLHNYTDELMSQIVDSEPRSVGNKMTQKELIHRIAVTLHALARMSFYLVDDVNKMLIESIIQLSFHPQAFTIGIDTIFKLYEQHFNWGALSKRGAIQSLQEKMEADKFASDEFEFNAMLMIATRWKAMEQEPNIGKNDPTLLLQDFFEKHAAAADCAELLEYLPRLIAYSRKRQVFKMTAFKAVGHILPSEIVEMVQNSIYNGSGVVLLLNRAVEEAHVVVGKDGQATRWLMDYFTTLGL